MNVRNASLLGLAASASSAAGLFVVFRVSVELLGAAVVGSWVLIQSVFFLSRVAEGGVGINLTRTFAVDRMALGSASPWSYCSAGLVLTVVPVVLIGLSLIVPGRILLIDYLHVDIAPEDVTMLLLLCLFQSVVSATSSVAMAVLEGGGKLSWRHMATMSSNLVFLLGAYPVLRWLGLFGLPLLYIVASATGGAIAFLMLLKLCGTGPRSSVSRIIAQIWTDSLRASGMAGLRAAFEPWTKFLVGSFGSLPVVAAVDLAFRVSTQVRVAIQSATQPLLYLGARTESKMSKHVHSRYSAASAMVVQANWSGLIVLTACAPLVSFLGFGHLSSEATVFILILAVGNAINSMGVIGYYSEASRGGLSVLLRIHVLMAAVNVLVGIVAGWITGPVGVVAAYALSFAIGGAALVRLWARATSLAALEVVKPSRGHTVMVVAALLLTASSLTAVIPRATSLGISMVASITFAAIVSALFLKRWRLVTG